MRTIHLTTRTLTHGGEDVTFYIEDPGTRDASGRYVKGPVTSHQVKAVIQPLAYAILQTLPEAYRVRQALQLHIPETQREQLALIAFGGSQRNPIYFLIDNKKYKAWEDQDFGRFGDLELIVIREENQI